MLGDQPESQQAGGTRRVKITRLGSEKLRGGRSKNIMHLVCHSAPLELVASLDLESEIKLCGDYAMRYSV